MSKCPEDYVEYVLKDVEKYKGIRKVKKTGFIERCTKKHCHPSILHPNPDDEFSMDSIGPNMNIVGDYVKAVKNLLERDEDVFEEPVLVEKMEPDGYMLLNGHHRWYAALRMGVSKLHIQIVNMIHEEDICEMINKSRNSKRVAFDLDEVLYTEDEKNQEALVELILAKRIKERLRCGAPAVIRMLQASGYDVWVYTSGYESKEYITSMFSMYEIEIEGIVNGLNEKRKSNKAEIARVRKLMSEKYNRSIHIDNESVTLIDTEDKSYEQFDIDRNLGWSDGIIKILNDEIKSVN